MAGRNCADIVFCIDASASMQPCLDAVRLNIGKLLEGLRENNQGMSWDVRFDFLAFAASAGGVYRLVSTRMGSMEIVNNIYHKPCSEPFFTRNLNEFCTQLGAVKADGEEQHLFALDTAMDFPWRPSAECHRVVVLLSDEPAETGLEIAEQAAKVDAIISKAMEKRIKLFIVAPESDIFYRLSAADRCEYTDLESTQDGLSNVDFSRMLAAIGKSVSVSQSYEGGSNTPMPLFGQDELAGTSCESLGNDSQGGSSPASMPIFGQM